MKGVQKKLGLERSDCTNVLDSGKQVTSFHVVVGVLMALIRKGGGVHLGSKKGKLVSP